MTKHDIIDALVEALDERTLNGVGYCLAGIDSENESNIVLEVLPLDDNGNATPEVYALKVSKIRVI